MEFSLNLGNEIIKDTQKNMTGRNYVHSPFSLQSAIGMLLLGTKGETWNQIWSNVFPKIRYYDANPLDDALLPEAKNPGKYAHESLLSLTNSVVSNNNGLIFTVANRLYIQEELPILATYKKNTDSCYSASAENVDFELPETRNKINTWVMNKTKDKIEDLLPEDSLSEVTMAVLVNAIYFYGSWKYPFIRTNTTKEDFKIPEGYMKATASSLQVDMMKQFGNFSTCYPRDIEARVLQMSYRGDTLSMLFILPEKVDGINDVTRNMTNFNFTECIKLKTPRPLDVEIPRFEITIDYQMKGILTGLGLKDMFDEDKADLTGISNSLLHPLYVEEVYHKAFITVDEEGSEAAAATTIVINTHSAPPPAFICDHPFLFMIVENNYGTVLFMGRVFNPTETIEVTKVYHA